MPLYEVERLSGKPTVISYGAFGWGALSHVPCVCFLLSSSWKTRVLMGIYALLLKRGTQETSFRSWVYCLLQPWLTYVASSCKLWITIINLWKRECSVWPFQIPWHILNNCSFFSLYGHWALNWKPFVSVSKHGVRGCTYQHTCFPVQDRRAESTDRNSCSCG